MRVLYAGNLLNSPPSSPGNHVGVFLWAGLPTSIGRQIFRCRLPAASGSSSAAAVGGSHGLGPGGRMPANAPRTLFGARDFGPNRNLVLSVMMSAVRARSSRSCSGSRRLRFISLRAATVWQA